MVKPKSMLEKKLNALKLINVSLMPKKTERFVSKAQSDIDVLTELYGTIALGHFILHVILKSVKVLLDISMVQTIKC